MKKLVYGCLLVLGMMACGEHNPLLGRWAMDIEGTEDSFIVLSDDSIISMELRFEHDTIYIETRKDSKPIGSKCIGVYSLESNEIRVVSNMGDEKLCQFKIDKDELVVSEKNEPENIVMRLRRIKEG